jgi:hypothetical protein
VQLETARTTSEAERNRVAFAEQELKKVLQAKMQSDQALTRAIDGFNEAKNQQAADLNRLKNELEMETGLRISAENQMGSLRQDKEQSESLLRSSAAALKDQLDDLRAQLETTRTALENEENTTKLLKENLAETAAEHKRARKREKEDQGSDNPTLIKQKRDPDEATATSETPEKNPDAVKIQNKTLADELNLVNQRKSQSDQKVRMLADDLKKVRTALDSERSHHQAGDKSIETLKQVKQHTEQDLCTSIEGRNTLNHHLKNERKMRVLSEDKSKSAIEEQIHPEQELSGAADEPACVRMQLSMEEKTEIKEEKCQDSGIKDTDIAVIAGSPAPVPQTTTDTQKSPVPVQKLTSSKPAFQITEVSQEAVTDIIDIFNDDDIIEEDNIS